MTIDILATLREAKEALEVSKSEDVARDVARIKAIRHTQLAIEQIEKAEPGNWSKIDGYEETYSISTQGEVLNTKTGRQLKQGLAGKGYPFVTLWKDGKGKAFYVHRLVATHFLPRSDSDTEVNHIDGNKLNNSFNNLEWCDTSHNARHARHVLNLPCGGLPPVKVTSIDCVTRERVTYESVEAAVRAGYNSSHIYRCLRNPKFSHKGKLWTRELIHPAALTIPENLDEIAVEVAKSQLGEGNNHCAACGIDVVLYARRLAARILGEKK